ncbi:Syntaxin-1B [Varanus komodoensis]|uniref:t-SNARE coiled-coil homology domain-containing protein n=1 Tax=Varanus komodoensis TaxID=61221 RepID=A0A8D2LPU9_VARKO|nr:syntaxin-3-like [Varanus komodoensis]KAF7244877.1 Syntaxin-1B [Varanus komodoensis]
MKDRLEELRNRVNEDGDSWDLDDPLSFDNPVFQEDEENPMSKVFQEISSLSMALEKLEELSENIDKKQQQVLCCTTEESICEQKQGLSKMKDNFTREAKALQPKLSTIQEALMRDGEQWLAVSRIRHCQLSVLINRYREIITRHYAKETQYVHRLKEQIQRQTELAGLKLQEEDVRRLVESPAAPCIVGQDLEVLKAKQHLAMVQVRHQQLLDLEAQIGELNALFLHMEVLVSEQQETINSIEFNVLRTLDYISQSNEEVKKALKYERHSRFSAVLSTVLGLCACCTCVSCLATPSVVG